MLSFSKPTKYWRLVGLTAKYPIHKMKLQKNPKFHLRSLAFKEVLPFKYQAFITLNCSARSYSSPQPKISATWKAAFPPICPLLWVFAFNGLSILYKIFRKQDLLLAWSHCYQASAELTNWAHFKKVEYKYCNLFSLKMQCLKSSAQSWKETKNFTLAHY